MKVLKSWGASGQVVLNFLPEDSRDLQSLEPVFIEFDGLPVPFFFESVQLKGNRAIVKFEDVDTLAEAEELVGKEVRLAETEEEPEDSILGLNVRDARSGRIIGKIVDFSDYAGNSVVTIEKADGQEVLLPLHEDLIVEVRDDVVTLAIPDGLL